MRSRQAPRPPHRLAAVVALLATMGLLLSTIPATALPPPPPVPDPAGGSTSTVRGEVVDDEGEPIAGVSVHASRTTIFATTRNDGTFVLPDVPQSSALIVAGKEGWAFTSVSKRRTVRLQLERDTDPARGEYPRPDADRRPFTDNSWLSLDGTWSFDFDPDNIGEREQWFDPDHQLGKAIRVPFGYQSLAAWGEEELATNEIFRSAFSTYRGTVWYQRSFTVPDNFDGQSTRLRIGAADWGAAVWLDGESVLPYGGDGYTEIDVDLGKLEPGSTHTIAVRVVAPPTTPETPYPQGKQTGAPNGEDTGWFTDIGGIWQSVWIEPYEAARLTRTQVTPTLEFPGAARTPSASAVTIDVAAVGADRATVAIRDPQDELIDTVEVPLTDGQGSITVPIPNPHLWEPDDPALYTADFTLGDDDGLRTSFGMRTIDRDWAPGHDDEYQYINLNNRPIYVRGVLDQAYNPWGVYTYTGVTAGPDLQTGTAADPGRGSILGDLQHAKDLGFNVIRTHLKVNEPAYYHLADQLGLMIWYDLPNAGWESQGDPKAEELFEETMSKAFERDHNHPSIVIWNIFNESWGINDKPFGQPIPEGAFPYIRRMVDIARETDSSRLIVDNSACCSNGHLDTDLNDFHYYLSSYDEWKRLLDDFDAQVHPGSTWNFNDGQQSGQPWLNSESGLGIGRFPHSVSLFRSYPKLNGYVSVQLVETEQEDGSPLTFDRQPNPPQFVDHHGEPRTYDLLQGDDAVSIMGPSTRTIEAGGTIETSIKISHFSDHDLSDATLRWKFGGYDDEGQWIEDAGGDAREISPERYTVTDAGKVSAAAPKGLRAGYLWVWLESGGETVAENYLTFDVPWSADDAAFSPTEPTAHTWTGGTETHTANGADRATGLGRGHFEYEIEAPAEVKAGAAQQATLIVEVSSTQAEGWYDPNNATAVRRFPTELTVSINGRERRAVTLPDDPNDPTAVAGRSRGPNAAGWGSRHGYRIAVPLSAQDFDDAAATVRFASDGGGLSIFGVGTGRLGIPPRVVSGEIDIPDTRPEAQPVDTRLSIYQTPAQISPTTRSGEVVVSVVNDTAEPARNVQVDLAPPRGWQATRAESPVIRSLAPGESRHVAFSVESEADVKTGQEADFTATAAWDDHAIQVIATSTVGFDPESYPEVGVDDDFTADSSADYTVHQPSSDEAIPALTFGDGQLSASGSGAYFGIVGHPSGPRVPSAATIVDPQAFIGDSPGQDAMFAGLIKDDRNYVMAWMSASGQMGLDFVIDGTLSNACCSRVAPLGPGDRWAVALEGNTVSIWADQGLGWTKIRSAQQDRVDFTEPGALDGWHYAAGLRGNAGTQSISRLEGRSR